MDPSHSSRSGDADAIQLAGCSMVGYPDSNAQAMRQVPMSHRKGVDREDIITEYIRVPSSDHVAVIVGKQGRRIKSIQDRTNTSISATARGQEPLFAVTGRENDVKFAKMEIISASELFSVCLSAHAPGNITEYLHVPRSAVSTLVGPLGSRLRSLQRQTLTHIVAPRRGREPVFRVTGQGWRVALACNIMNTYITGVESEDEDDC